MRKIILASGSPRRKELLEKTGLIFEVRESNHEEDMLLPLPPAQLAQHLSRGKAQAVAENENDAIVIAADTFVVLEGKPLGKPRDKADALSMLERLNGKAHEIVTGYTIVDARDGTSISKAVTSRVYFKQVPPAMLKNYVDSGEPLDKAGSYAIQGLGALLIEKFEGDFPSAMGLPISDLAETLKEFDIHIL